MFSKKKLLLKKSYSLNGGCGPVLFIVGIAAYLIIAWIVNLTKLVDLDFASPYKAEVIRVVSLAPPIAAFTAFMDVGEEND